MKAQERIYDDYWKAGGQTVGPHIRFKQRILTEVVGSGKRVLDVGCGDALTSSVLASENEVYGVDVSETALAIAKKRGLKVMKSNLDEGLPEVDSEFDVVLLLDILEHVHDPEHLLDAAVSKMNKDAMLVVSVPNTMNILTRICFLFGRYVDFMDMSHKEGKLFSEHLHVFSKSKLEDLLRSRSLKISSRHYFFPIKFNEERFKKFQFGGDVFNLIGLHRIFPSLFSLGFLYVCTLS